MDTAEIIAERKKTHGDFREVARINRDLLAVIAPTLDRLSSVQAMSLHMILHKISRIVCGNPNFADHWADVQGYAKLAQNEIEPTP